MREKIFKLLSLLTVPERHWLFRILAIMALVGFVEVVGITSILPFLTVVARPTTVSELPALKAVHEWLGGMPIESFIMVLGVVSLAAILISNLLSLLALRSVIRFSFRLNRNLAVRVLTSYLRRSYAFFLTQNTTQLMVNVTGEVEGVVNGVLLPGLQALAKVITAVFIVIAVVAVDPLLALAFLGLFGGIYAALYRLTRNSVTRYGGDAVEARRLLFSYSNEAFGGIKELKLAGREKYYLDRFSVAAERFARSQIKYNVLAAAPRYLVETTAFGSVVFVVLFLLKTGRDLQTAIPFLALYAIAGYRLIPVFQAMFHNVSILRANWRSVELLSAENPAAVGELPVPALVAPVPFNTSIRLDGITFTYPEATTPTIKDIDLEIRKNTTVGFVGETGAGKTTLVDLLLGLLGVTGGSILVDGVEITEANVRGWQKNIGYVPQQIYLSDSSVADNIAFGVPADQIDMTKVEAASRAAQLHRFVDEELPEKYRTKVGERGVRLSGGQRQRVGIARALYHDPTVLVFDEATSALDGVTESAVVEAIRGLTRQKTILTIAHRIATVVDCDVIFVIENGRVVDHGTYDELIGRNDRFRRMARVG